MNNFVIRLVFLQKVIFSWFPQFEHKQVILYSKKSFCYASLLSDFLQDLSPGSVQTSIKRYSKRDEVALWQTEASWVYICLSHSDLTRIHRHCVNTREIDLYVSTLLHLVQSLAYHTRLMTTAFSEKAHKDLPALSYFILTRTGTTGSLDTVKGSILRYIEVDSKHKNICFLKL